MSLVSSEEIVEVVIAQKKVTNLDFESNYCKVDIEKVLAKKFDMNMFIDIDFKISY